MTCAVPQPHNCICWALALSMSLLRPSDPIHITLHCVADCPVLDHVAKLDPNRKTNTLLQPGLHPSDKPVTDPHQTYMFLNTETHHCVPDPNSASIMEQLTQNPNACLTCVWLAFHTAPIPKTNPGRTQVMGRRPSTPCLPETHASVTLLVILPSARHAERQTFGDQKLDLNILSYLP